MKLAKCRIRNTRRKGKTMSFFKRLFSKKKKEEPKQKGPVMKKGIPKKETQKPSKDGMIIKVVHIEKYTTPKTIKEGEVLKIPVSGHFSNAGWKLKEAYAKVKDNNITLTVVGQIKEGMMHAQVMKKYDTVIELEGLKKGKYKIKPEKGISDQKQLTVE